MTWSLQDCYPIFCTYTKQRDIPNIPVQITPPIMNSVIKQDSVYHKINQMKKTKTTDQCKIVKCI